MMLCFFPQKTAGIWSHWYSIKGAGCFRQQ